MVTPKLEDAGAPVYLHGGAFAGRYRCLTPHCRLTIPASAHAAGGRYCHGCRTAAAAVGEAKPAQTMIALDAGEEDDYAP